MHAIQATNVEELIVMEMGTHNDQWRRTFETHLNGDSMKMFQQQLAGATSYQPAMLNGIANNFIMPAVQPEKKIVIPGGFGDQRMMFRGRLRHTFRAGGHIIEYIQGYTNFVGGDANGFDRDLEFYVNSVVTVRHTQERTPLGIQTYSNVTDNSHILVDNNWEGIYNTTEQRMRPEDIITAMSRAHLDVKPGSLLDGRSAHSNVAVKSNRANTMAPHFMSKVLEANRQARESDEFGQGEQQILNQARGYASDPNVGKDPFLSAISHIRGDALGNRFTWNDIQRLDPNVSRVTTVLRMGVAEKAEAHWAGQTEYWHIADQNTQAATIIAHNVSGLMFEEKLVELTFKCTNNIQGGGVLFTPIQGLALSEEHIGGYVEKFAQRFRKEVWDDLTHSNQVACSIEVQMNLYADSVVSVSFNNEPLVPYGIPSYSDALNVNILTGNPEVPTQIAEDFDGLISLLNDNGLGNQGDYQPPQLGGVYPGNQEPAGIVDVFGNALSDNYKPLI